jgi:FkbM family methyltransferase
VSLNLDLLGGPYATVLDVGAFRGDFALACLARWHDCAVLSFEPLEPRPRRHRVYRRRWRWFGTALGSDAGLIEMQRNEFIPSSSVLPMAELHREAFPYTRQTETAEVGMAMLDEFVSLVHAPALLKIDVQGYELEVLKGAVEVLPFVEAIVCEVSHEELYVGAPTFVELDRYIGSRGFRHSTPSIDTLYHPDDPERLLQSDELWVRDR